MKKDTPKNKKELLKKASSKNTKTRNLILDVFLKNRTPISVDEIERELKDKKINQSTIYRSINQFTEKGIIKRIDFNDKKSYFEIINKDNHHHHIICTKCKKMEDVSICEIENIEKKIIKKSKKFSKIENHSLEFFAICNNCLKR